MCLTQRPNKPKSRSLEQRKLHCRAKQGGCRSSCSKEQNSLMIFGEQFLQAKFVGRPAGRVTFVLLVGGKVTGRCSRNFHHQPSGSCQSGIHVLALSLTLPPSTGMGSLVPGAELRHMYQIAVHMPQEEPGPRPISTLLFLDAFPLFLHSLTPLIRN